MQIICLWLDLIFDCQEYGFVGNKYLYIIVMRTDALCLVVLALCLGLLRCSIVPHPPPIVSHLPRTYKISLDDTPQRRWAPLVHDYKQPLRQFMQQFNKLPIPAKFYDGVQFFAKNVYQHKDFIAEVDAVAKLSGYSFDKMFFINFMYEYSTACTGLLVCNSQGKVLHGRNLDFSMWELLANLLVHAEFYKGGRLVFTSDLVVGSVLALTGSKPGAFSVNVDTRTAKNFDVDLISVLIKNAIPTCWLVQKVLQQQTTYANAVRRLKSTRIGGPVYFIISGIDAYEGMVIERQVNSVKEYYQLSSENWFLVQTNYDRDQPDPAEDQRRVPVQKKLHQIGKTIDQEQLFGQLLSQWPTFNLKTIMSAVMVASTGYHNTTAWYGSNPQNYITSQS